MTIAGMKKKLSDWGCSFSEFNKAKSKEDKKHVLMETWFCKFELPKLLPSSQPSGEPAVSATSSKMIQLNDALAVKPQVTLAPVAEEPEYLAKILLLKEEFLKKICEQGKTLELRKSTICNQKDALYLAVGNMIHAKCVVSHPLSICNDEEFNKLKPAHLCENPPYAYPFVGHRISSVQVLVPLEFTKLDACIGRSLYRPLGWTPESAAEKEIEAEGAAGSAKVPKQKNKKSKKKQEESGDGEEEAKPTEEPNKGGKTSKAKAAAAKANPKRKSKLINLAAPTLLENQSVEVVNAKDHLRPGEKRLQAKKDFFSKQDKTSELSISGGLLAHLNNIAFPRSPASTIAYLLGSVTSKGIVLVNGCWCADFPEQENIYDQQWDNKLLQKLCETKSHAVVGCCIVKPTVSEASDKFTMQDFHFAKRHQEECNKAFVTAVVGADKFATFYRITELGLQAENPQVKEGEFAELGSAVLWTGKGSLYYASVVSEELETMEQVREAAKQDLEKQMKKSSLKRSLNVNIARNEAIVPNHDAEAKACLKQISEELEVVAAFLCNHMADFASGKNMIQELEHLFGHTAVAAKEELVRAQVRLAPNDVSTAAALLNNVNRVKNQLDVRIARRTENVGHSFDGAKYKKRKYTSSTTSKVSKRRRSESEFVTPSKASTSEAPSSSSPPSNTSPESSSPPQESEQFPDKSPMEPSDAFEEPFPANSVDVSFSPAAGDSEHSPGHGPSSASSSARPAENSSPPEVQECAQDGWGG
jgi:hypothetical protein